MSFSRYFCTSMAVLFIIVVANLNIIAQADEKSTHEALNAKLVSFYSGFQSLDIDALATVYTDDAVFISESRKDPIIAGKENILRVYQGFFDKINHKQASLEVDFRVIDRKIQNDSATDVGYYLVRFHPKADSGDPVSEFAGKFVNRYLRINQQWLVAVDANTRSEPQFYYEATPVANLYFGRQFIQEADPTKDNVESDVGQDTTHIYKERP